MKSLKLNKVEIIGYVIVLAVLIVGMILSFSDPEYFEQNFAVEDGLIEYLTALMLLLGSLLSFKRLFNKRLSRNFYWLITTSMIAIAFLFGAGEEISWGQRIFEVETNEFFNEYNAQQEINLHNLVVGETKINKLIFGQLLTIFLIIYLIVVPVLFRKYKTFNNLIKKFGVPVAKTHHAVVFIIATIIILIMDSSKKWEIYEFSFGVIFFLLLLYPYNQKIYESKQGSV